MEPTGDFHPLSERDDDADDAVDAFLRRAPAAMVSVIVHLIVLIVLAFLSLRTQTKDPLVIELDSTGSMGQEIKSVRQRIRQIGESVLRKIPNAKFSLATYRDLNDNYVARGIPLTKDLPEMEQFVMGVVANGGGDRPEAVQAGMLWAMRENEFRSNAQKVMIIFGDAPPHPYRLNACLDLAEKFRGYSKGRVYTVTCRSPSPLPEFYSIARTGGGDAFVMANVDQLMDDLLVITFGTENRDQVLKFFELDPRSDPPGERKAPMNRRRTPRRR